MEDIVHSLYPRILNSLNPCGFQLDSDYSEDWRLDNVVTEFKPLYLSM